MKLRKSLLIFITLMALAVAISPVAGQDGDLMSITAENCDYGGNIQSIEAVDELTVRITFCNPDPAVASKLAFVTTSIVPSEYLESTGGTGDILNQPVGTGPYMLENWDLGNEVVLTRNDNYWGTPAIEPTAVIRWSTEASARLVELQSGTVDAIDNPAPADIDIIRNDPNLQFLERPAATVVYLGMNNRIAPFDNQQVRQAVAHAIDRQRIVDNFFPPGSQAAVGFIPPVIFGNTPDVEPLAFDPALAEQMLDEAGFPRGEDGIRFSTEISLRDVDRAYLPTPVTVATDLQAQLAAVGIQADINVMESGAFLDAALAGETLPMVLPGWSADYFDATNFFDTHFSAGASEQFGDFFPEINDEIAAGGQTADEATRLEHYTRVNELLRDLVPMVPLAHGGSGMAYQARILNAHAQSAGQESIAALEDPDDDNIVFMQGAEPISLYCNDESDGESFRVCEQIYESLTDYQIGGTEVIPGLAESYEVNEDSTVWTFHLREGVTFHDGSALDANDVVASYAAEWDASQPTHTGRTGDYVYWTSFFGGFLNAPEEAAE